MKYSKKRLMALMLLSSMSFTSVSFAASIQEMENKKASTIKSAQELKNQINSLESEKKALSTEVDSLNVQIANLEAQINELKLQIAKLESDIIKTEEEIIELEDNIGKNQKEFEDRVGIMYMSSNVGYLDILFAAKDVDDLLSKTSTMKFITEHDKEVINELKNDKLVIDAKKAELKGQKLSLEISKATLDEKNSELYSAKESKLSLIADATKKQELTQEELSSLESQIQSLEKSISDEKAAEAKRAEEKAAREAEARKAEEAAKKAAQEAANKKNYSSNSSSNVSTQSNSTSSSTNISTNLGSGTLGWPVPSTRRISSGYGYRNIFGYQEFHMGIDIPAPLGTPIASADEGTVIFSGYSGSYGNLMKVQHSSGVVTYYAHLSSFVASTGQKVAKGQTIAKMGSTGNSTGSHLHFEVRINGSHTNPLNYVN